ncbi:ECF-type sigma factor [Acanthopleuribacter pedis]|uniref:RNA polymerase sigma-70 ECF-like HTH domain-containing protein n=1 Tax=Acanthopleuribacter pedis TaxID=442870 RepID=A0A8J7Q7E2_9BACT|nr:ECF-type sigma factor [Acanthopleuribacter pedis]MBO1318699.1 hypothetical protein [Acanthopleuribacter pedis]
MSLPDLHTALSFLTQFSEKTQNTEKDNNLFTGNGQTHDLSPRALTRILNFLHQTQTVVAPDPPPGLDQQKIAAKVLRALLVQHLKNPLPGGPDQQPTHPLHRLSDAERERVLATDRALFQLEALDPDLCEIVELRYFLGLDLEEVARLTGHSNKLIAVKWKLAKTWLFQETQTGRQHASL